MCCNAVHRATSARDLVCSWVLLQLLLKLNLAAYPQLCIIYIGGWLGCAELPDHSIALRSHPSVNCTADDGRLPAAIVGFFVFVLGIPTVLLYLSYTVAGGRIFGTKLARLARVLAEVPSRGAFAYRLAMVTRVALVAFFGVAVFDRNLQVQPPPPPPPPPPSPHTHTPCLPS